MRPPPTAPDSDQRRTSCDTTVATKQDIAELRSFVDRALIRLHTELTAILRPSKRYMNVEECATYVGRSREAVRMLVKRRQIPHLLVGRRVQFDRERIDRWINRHSRRGAQLSDEI